jgi:diacylglycerol kinase family enzyme
MPFLRKLALIGNPKAGDGNVRRHLYDGERLLWGRDLKIFLPNSSDEMRHICQNLDPTVFEAAVVLGGDGTQNHALRGLLQSGVPLFPFPSGTANDFSRELHIRADWAQVQRLIDDYCVTEIDVIEVEGTPYATVAGVGVGAVLTESFNRLRGGKPLYQIARRVLGDDIYTLMTAKILFFDPSCARVLRIFSGTFDETLETAAVFVSNQEFLGGNIRVAPKQDNADQMFHVLILPGTGATELLRSLFELRRGSLSPDFISFSTSEVTIESPKGESIRVFGDGETLTESASLNFRVRPRALRVFREAEA